MQIATHLSASSLRPQVERLFELSAQKIRHIQATWDPSHGTPVFTIQGHYTSRGWTEWTQGFQVGSALLQFDATGDAELLALGELQTLTLMTPHLTHTGVHDHGFNNISTYGTLWRLQREGRLTGDAWRRRWCELALRVSGAVQAARWTQTRVSAQAPLGSAGFIYSFNGAHSLFADTIRTLRSLAVAHQLGHVLLGENDRRISLLERLIQHADTTARYTVYYGDGRDAYDVSGRVAQESLFNQADGTYRAPSTQQGYSPFTTWTRGHAWCLLGYPELLEYLDSVPDSELEPYGGRASVAGTWQRAAVAVAEFYLRQTPLDGVPYWDTGAPGLTRLGDYLHRPADPFNSEEPVDSSAAAIAAQGLLRLGNYLRAHGDAADGERYRAAALTVAATLLAEPYLSTDPDHEGLLLHSIYHRPNGWDAMPPEATVPRGESSLWGDYHLRELGLLLLREVEGGPYPTFYDPSSTVGAVR